MLQGFNYSGRQIEFFCRKAEGTDFFTSFVQMNLSPGSKQKNKISPLGLWFHASLFPFAEMAGLFYNLVP